MVVAVSIKTIIISVTSCGGWSCRWSGLVLSASVMEVGPGDVTFLVGLLEFCLLFEHSFSFDMLAVLLWPGGG